jgi:hypothetical protein
MPGGLDFYTKLLLHGNGPQGSINIIDSSFMCRSGIITAGSADIDTAYSKFGGSSLYLQSANSAYITIPNNSDFTLGSSNWTIDLWFYLTTTPGTYGLFSQYQDSNNYFEIYLSGTTSIIVYEKNGGSAYVNLTATTTLAATTWYHLAVERYGSLILVFLNGVLIGNAACTHTFPAFSAPIIIGARTGGTANYFNGRINEYRLSVGIARWAANFALPGRPYTNDVKPYTYGSFATPRAYKPKAAVWTRKHFYNDLLYCQLSPSTPNTHGQFRIIIKDPTRKLEADINPYEPVWIWGKIVNKDRMMRGVIERTMPVRYKGGQWGLEISGRSMSCYCELRKTESIIYIDTPTPIEQVIYNYIAPNVPELGWNYITAPTVTPLQAYTILNGRTYWDILKELAALASTAGVVWGVWVDDGNLYGEHGQPNVHFGPVKDQAGTSLIPVYTMHVFDMLAPRDASQVFTEAIIGWNNGGYIAYQTTDAIGPGINSAYSGSFASGGYVTVVPGSNPLAFTSSSPFSIEAWIYPTGLATTGLETLLVKGYSGSTTTTNYGLRLNTAVANQANLEFFYRNSGDSAWDIYTTALSTVAGAGIPVVLQNNSWYHIVVSYTMANRASMNIYLNGQLCPGSWTTGTGSDTPSNPSGNLYLGCRSVGGTTADKYVGYMDDVRLWNYAMIPKDALNHYQGNYQSGDQLLWIAFEEGSGLTLSDSSGMGAVGQASASGFSFFNYGNLPNSQSIYGVIPQYIDRTWTGSTEAQTFANAMLRVYRQPSRFVEVSVPLDGRYRAGQYVYCTDKSFRGRAILDQVTHYFTDDPYTALVLLYM